MKQYVILLLLVLPELALAQTYYQEALVFSNTQLFGSARIQALGGTSVALGADPTTILTNPAGLGLYNRSEISIAAAFDNSQTKSVLNGSTTNTNKSKFSFDQIGGIFSIPSDGIGGWLGGSWGFGIQKINDFNYKTSYSGVNNSNSLIDYFIERTNGSSAGNIPDKEDAFDLASLAYYNYLIGPWSVVDSSNPEDEYFSDVTSFYRPSVQQSETIETSGSQYQISLGYGGNFADALYFGANIGIVALQYEMLKNYSESNYDYSQTDSATFLPLTSFNTTEKLNIDGIGVNLTIGMIVRPIPAFRIGASISTPTSYELFDSYETTMGAEWNNFYYEDLIGGDTLLNSTFIESAIIESNYTLTTPTKYAIGAAFFLNKLGFITIDAEFKNYGKVNLESQDFSMQSENDYIKEHYANQVNLRTGFEIRLSPFRIRGGFAITNPPNGKQVEFKSTSQTFSGGLGLLLEQFYADFALSYNTKSLTYSPYLLSDFSEPIVDIKQHRWRSVLTVGVKF